LFGSFDHFRGLQPPYTGITGLVRVIHGNGPMVGTRLVLECIQMIQFRLCPDLIRASTEIAKHTL